MMVRSDAVADLELRHALSDRANDAGNLVPEDGAGLPADVPVEQVGAADSGDPGLEQRLARTDLGLRKVDRRDRSVFADRDGLHARGAVAAISPTAATSRSTSSSVV